MRDPLEQAQKVSPLIPYHEITGMKVRQWMWGFFFGVITGHFLALYVMFLN